MSTNGSERAKRRVNFKILRYKPGFIDPPRYDTFAIEVDERMTVLDALEHIKATQDSTLLYRHSCHHASCGTCAMKANGREDLSCVINVFDLDSDNVVVDPLGSLPLVADLVVDMAAFAERFAPLGMTLVRESEFAKDCEPPAGIEQYTRYEDCVECGACLSACPVANTTPFFIGPAGLAAAYRALTTGDRPAKQVFAHVDSSEGVWRCHGAMECSAACPSDVDPGGKIMALRRELVKYKVKRIFGSREE